MDHCDVTFNYPKGVDAVLTGCQMTPVFYRSANEQYFREHKKELRFGRYRPLRNRPMN